MIVQLATSNADRDITSLITVLTDTPDASNPMLCQGYIALGDGAKNLDGTGGDFELVVTVGGQTIEPSPQTITFSTAVRAGVWTVPFPVPANAEVILRVLSPNAADSDVDVTAYLYQVDAVDVVAIGGGSQSATDLKDFADTGYNPSTHKVAGVVLTDTCTTNTDMRGTDSAATEAKQDIIDTNVDTIVAKLPSKNFITGTDSGTSDLVSNVDDNYGLIEQVQAVVDSFDGTDGVILATTQANYAPAKAGDEMTIANDQSSVTVGTVNALGVQAKADVNAEVDDVISTDATSEPSQGKPAATPSIRTILSWFYAAFRNAGSATAAQVDIKNDAGTQLAKATIADDGTTFTKTEFETGA